jgi:hypothetical protein
MERLEEGLGIRKLFDDVAIGLKHRPKRVANIAVVIDNVNDRSARCRLIKKLRRGYAEDSVLNSGRVGQLGRGLVVRGVAPEWSEFHATAVVIDPAGVEQRVQHAGHGPESLIEPIEQFRGVIVNHNLRQ